MLGLNSSPSPVRRIIQSRKQSLILGIQPVGFLHRRMPSRGGIFAWVIPAKLSPWTFDEGLRPTCRIWSWMTTGVPLWGASAHPPFWQQVRCFLYSYHPRRRFRLKTRPQSTPSIPKPAQPYQRLPQSHRSASSFNSSSFVLEITRKLNFVESKKSKD